MEVKDKEKGETFVYFLLWIIMLSLTRSAYYIYSHDQCGIDVNDSIVYNGLICIKLHCFTSNILSQAIHGKQKMSERLEECIYIPYVSFLGCQMCPFE